MELDWLKRWNEYSPKKIALVDGDTGRSLDYRTLYFGSLKIAEDLRRSFGICKGDRVALVSMNELETLVLFFALRRLGAILVPLNYRWTSREIQEALEDCDPRLFLYQDIYRETVRNIEERPGSSLRLQSLYIGPGALFEAPLESETHFPEGSFDETYHGEESDPCMILYTSGTTGKPKGAVLSQGMTFWNSINTTWRLNLSNSDSAVVSLPLFHTGAWNVLTTPFLHRGGCILLTKKFESSKILGLCQNFQTSILFGLPTTMDMMARDPSFDKTDLSSLRFAVVGGEPMPIQLIQKWHSKGIAIRQGYGLTEFGPNVFSLGEEDAVRKIGSIGFPNFNVEAKIIDAQGHALGPNQIGELALKGPMAMSGYWNNPQATAETLRGGWLFTGDLVKKDEEGFFYVVGRKKEMYKSGGENVYPAEVERILRQHKEVTEAVVIGVPDLKWGEVGLAFISSSQGLDSLESLQRHCSENLAKFKIPKYFRFLRSLPRSETGKINRLALKQAWNEDYKSLSHPNQ